MMDIDICQTNYTLEAKIENLLDILFYIKKNKNTKLAFRSGCRSGVCGSCAVVVDGVEKLACKTTIKKDTTIEPLKNHKIIRDLVVDLNSQAKFLQNTKAHLETFSGLTITQKDQSLIDIESNCILCSSCISSCPVYSVNSEFLSPLALARVYRYTTDKKEKDIKTKIDSIQKNGIWDCTLCGECTAVCPQGIDPKMDITMLRSQSTQFGYSDPNFMAMDFGFGSF